MKELLICEGVLKRFGKCRGQKDKVKKQVGFRRVL